MPPPKKQFNVSNLSPCPLPLLREGGSDFLREAKPLFDFPFLFGVFKSGGSPSSINTFPPLLKRRGG
jgi:hypothetical protein